MNASTENNCLIEDGRAFKSRRKISFGQCGPDGKLKLSEILRYCSDLATDLYTAHGCTRAFLAEHGYAQLVSRSTFHVNTFPGENDVLYITVSEEKSQIFQAVRSYEFKDEKGNVLVEGKSTWVFVEPESRRIVKTSDFEYLIASDKETAFPVPDRIKVPSDVEPVFLGAQKILLSHADANGHLTNSKYIDFAVDFLPLEFRKKTLSDFKINYSREIYPDEVMEVFGRFCENGRRIIVTGKNNGTVCFECELLYL